MSRFITRLSLTLLLIGAPLVTAAARALADPEANAPTVALSRGETYTLASGLRVVLDEDHRAPLVAISVLYRAGRADDPAGRRGLADVIARVIETAATRHLGRDEARTALFKALSVPPFWPRAAAAVDYTALTFTVPSHALALALWIEGDRMGFCADGLSSVQLDLARRAAEEAQQRREAGDFNPAFAAVEAAIFGPEHPYARAFATGKPELDRLTVEEVRAHLQRLYQPGNATLVVSGDFAPATVKPLVAQYFDALPRAPRAVEVEAPRPALAGERRVEVVGGSERATVTLAWPTPPLFADDDLRLDLLARVLEGRLGRRLVRALHAVESLGVREHSLRRGSVFAMTLQLAAASQADEAIRLVDLELARLRAAAPSDAEIAGARDAMIVSLASGHDAVSGRASSLAALDFNAGGTGGLDRARAAYTGADGEALLRVMRQYLPADRRVVVRGSARAAAPGSRPPAGGG